MVGMHEPLTHIYFTCENNSNVWQCKCGTKRLKISTRSNLDSQFQTSRSQSHCLAVDTFVNLKSKNDKMYWFIEIYLSSNTCHLYGVVLMTLWKDFEIVQKSTAIWKPPYLKKSHFNETFFQKMLFNKSCFQKERSKTALKIQKISLPTWQLQDKFYALSILHYL